MYIYLFLTAIGLTPGGSSTVYIYTQTIHRIQSRYITIKRRKKIGKYGPCPVFASCAVTFALKLRKEH
jgi:hypothetical protein